MRRAEPRPDPPARPSRIGPAQTAISGPKTAAAERQSPRPAHRPMYAHSSSPPSNRRCAARPCASAPGSAAALAPFRGAPAAQAVPRLELRRERSHPLAARPHR
eukprot:scaffold8201_cov73-Isochrysis_galbana.AAC.2